MNNQNPVLLRGKLRTPYSIPGVIRRIDLESRILDALNSGSMCLVTAPAGFGKTTLVTQTLHQWYHPVAWFQLDAEDNNPVQFWTYLVAALQTIHPDLPNYAQSMSTAQDSYEQLIKIANALESVPTPFVLVLDDFHHIVSESVHRQLEWFINRRLIGLRLILISRAESPLNLARLQVSHRSETVDASALHFTAREVEAFLCDTMALNVERSLVEQLVQVTEGWPAALHLMALKLRHHSGSPLASAQLLTTDVKLMRYFDEEVFSPLPTEFQEFLLRTSLLKELEPDLCRAVTGDDGHRILEQLTRDQLFVTRLNSDGQHYRYHSLFSDYLQLRIRHNFADWVPAIHRSAATYYQQRKMLEQAVEHAILSDDVAYAESLICEAAWSLITIGKRDVVALWIERLPPGRLENNPRIGVYYAWVLFLQGHFDRAEHQMSLAENGIWLHPGTLREDLNQLLMGEMMILRGLIAHLAGNFQSTIEYAQRALQLLPEDQVFLRGCALGNLGYTQWMNGDAESAHDTIDEIFLSFRRTT